MDRRVPALRKDFLTFVVTTPNSRVITIPKADNNQWNWQGMTIKSIEGFVAAVRRKLLASGLGDYTMTFETPTESEAARLKYSFSDRISCLQFQALVLPDITGTFIQKIDCKTRGEADLRRHNIKRFMTIFGIKGSVIWLDNEKALSVLTHTRYDDLAIAIHHETGRFDEAHYKPDVNRVVTRSVLFSNNLE
jgi:hypothetical protein